MKCFTVKSWGVWEGIKAETDNRVVSVGEKSLLATADSSLLKGSINVILDCDIVEKIHSMPFLIPNIGLENDNILVHILVYAAEGDKIIRMSPGVTSLQVAPPPRREWVTVTGRRLEAAVRYEILLKMEVHSEVWFTMEDKRTLEIRYDGGKPKTYIQN